MWTWLFKCLLKCLSDLFFNILHIQMKLDFWLFFSLTRILLFLDFVLAFFHTFPLDFWCHLVNHIDEQN